MVRCYPEKYFYHHFSSVCRHILLVFTILFALASGIIVFAHPVRGQEPLPQSRKIVLYLVEGMTWERIYDAPESFPVLYGLGNDKDSAVGVMYAAATRLLDVYLTLGAGSAMSTAGGFGNIESDGHGGVIFRGIKNLEKNEGSVHSEPGLMGELLKKDGVRVCLIDSGDENYLPVLMLMDEQGRVLRADAGRKFISNENGAARANHKAMMAAFNGMYRECGLIAVRHGDTAHAIMQYGEDSNEASRALMRADNFLDTIIKSIDKKNTTLMVLGLPVDGHYKTPANGRLLTPVIIHASGIRTGMVTTDTTRFPYLCAAIDIMPTIMRIFGLKAPDGITGRPVYFDEHRKAPSGVLDVNKRAVATDRFLYPGQVANSVLYLVMLFLSAVSLKRAASGAASRGLHTGIRIIALVLMLFPAVCIAFSPIMSNGMSIAANLGISLGMSFAGALFLYAFFRGGSWAAIAALGFTVFLICADLAFGWGMNRSNIFGFSPILGKRFYGLGNESMAVVVGALVMGVPLLLHQIGLRGRAASYMACAFMLPGIFFIGLPTLGANVGGTITAAIAAVVVVFSITRRRLTPSRIMLMIFTCVFFVGLFLVVDWYQGAERGTHMAHSLMRAHASNASVFVDILARKLKIQIFVLFSTVYGYCLALTFGIVLWSYHREGSRLRAVLESRPMLHAGAGAALWAAGAGFLFNDSGLPIVAIILGFAASTVCYFIPDFKVIDSRRP